MNITELNVLSLFSGIETGLSAIKELGYGINNWYSSEVNKWANMVSDYHHPEIIKLGDVQSINYQMLPYIDLLIGGSPCQGFSLAGKQLNFKDPRSALFFEFVHALRELSPKYFMLENVCMNKDVQDAISELMGCEPVKINAALVSAQNRDRLFWTNIPNIKQPDDMGIVLSDILESHLPSCGVGARIVGRRLNELGKREDYNRDIPISQYLEIRTDQKSNCMTTVYKDSVVPYFKTDKRLKIKFNQSKASCLTAGGNSGGNHSDMDILVIEPDVCRRYSVTECERLQSMPYGYVQVPGISPSQQYKMLGNGWNRNVVKHIFKGLL